MLYQDFYLFQDFLEMEEIDKYKGIESLPDIGPNEVRSTVCDFTHVINKTKYVCRFGKINFTRSTR